MIDLINRNLSIHQLLKENLDKFKEIFIEYYGEESRDFIEYKFSHLATIGILPIDVIKCYIREIEEKEIGEDLLEQEFNTFPLGKRELFDYDGFENYTSAPIVKCEGFIDYIKIDKEKRIESYKTEHFDELHSYVPTFTKEEYDNIWNNGEFPDWMNKLPLNIQNKFRYYCTEEGYKKELEEKFNNARPILKRLYPEITIDNFDKILSENPQLTEQLIRLSEAIRKRKKECERQYSEYYSQVEEKNKIEANISAIYYKEFIIENFDLIPEEDREEVMGILKTNRFDKLSDKIISIFGRGITSYYSAPIEAFTTTAEEKLLSEEVTNYVKEEIISSRIEFFKINGIDLGDNYEAYLESEDAKKIWPSKDRVDKLIESFNKIKNKFNNHLYTSVSSYKKLEAEIDQLGLLSKDDGLNASKFINCTTCITPNLINGPYGIEVFPLVFVTPDFEGIYTDHMIVHELNHVIELTLTSINENTYYTMCGWDIVDGTYNDTRKEVDTINKQKIRKYELFNEIINEKIAQEISELMHQKGIFILDDKEVSSYVDYSSYENMLFIIEDFYKEFKDVIIKSRRNGNIQVIFDEVGKENFDALNELFTIFNENFNSFSYKIACDELEENEDTKGTRIIKEIMTKRDEILNKMRIHSARKKIEGVEKEKGNQI